MVYAEGSEQKKKRMKIDGDNARFPTAASMRNQLDHPANLKGEQVYIKKSKASRC